MSSLTTRVLIASLSASLGWASVTIAANSSCNHQLTVEEADAAVVTSCVLLSRALTQEHPDQLDAVVAQACQPGHTRNLIENILARGARSSTTEFLDLDFPSGSESGVRGPGSGQNPDPSRSPKPEVRSLLLSDAGVMSSRGLP